MVHAHSLSYVYVYMPILINFQPSDRYVISLCSSFSLPKEPVHGYVCPTDAPDGVILHSVVPLCQANQPLPRLLPVGNLQQHHPVPVRW